MPKLQLYDKLLQFPMFQGMSRADLLQMVTHTRLDFVKFPEGKRILKTGERCDRFYFLINGALKIETASEDHGYTVSEEITAPYIIQPECIFAISLLFRSPVQSLTVTYLVNNDQKQVLKPTENFIVFRLNMLNMFAMNIQKQILTQWQSPPKSLEERIVRFFSVHCQQPTGKKTVSIYMERLAAEVNDSRLDISRALNKMQNEGLLQLSRGRITIPALEKLISGI